MNVRDAMPENSAIVWMPLAITCPNGESVASRWIGNGSYLAANSVISSSSTR